MLHRLISTYLFVGYLPKAPGTWGSLLSLPLIWFLYKLGFPYYLGFYLILFPLAVWASYKTALELNNPDPDEVVIDEVLGMMTVYFFCSSYPAQYGFGFYPI
jgi:phosphatidylglycerophosphatase A